MARRQLVLASLYHCFLVANAGRSSSRLPMGASQVLEYLLRDPLSDDDECEFLARWTTWRDGRMAVANRVGE